VLEIGLAGLAAAGLFAWLADEEKHSGAGCPAGPSADPANGRTGRRDALSCFGDSHKLFPTPVLWGFFLATCVLFSLRDFAASAMSTSASLFLQNAHGWSPKVTGMALSGIFLASAISNPLFGRLSDRGRIRWITFVLLMAAGLISLFPRVPVEWMVPVLVAYGFFLMSSYPMTEAALMEAVPDAVRGRIVGLSITLSGLVGNLSHWLVGDWVEKLGPRAALPASYLPLYAVLSLLILMSLSALPFLHGLRKREHLESAAPAAPPLSALH
jgi:MFS family permease